MHTYASKSGLMARPGWGGADGATQRQAPFAQASPWPLLKKSQMRVVASTAPLAGPRPVANHDGDELDVGAVGTVRPGQHGHQAIGLLLGTSRAAVESRPALGHGQRGRSRLGGDAFRADEPSFVGDKLVLGPVDLDDRHALVRLAPVEDHGPGHGTDPGNLPGPLAGEAVGHHRSGGHAGDIHPLRIGVVLGHQPIDELTVVFFVRPTGLQALCEALADADLEGEPDLVVVVAGPVAPCAADAGVVPDPQGRLADAYGLRPPADAAAPVGYAVVDEAGRIRYRTLDPEVEDLLGEVDTILRAA